MKSGIEYYTSVVTKSILAGVLLSIVCKCYLCCENRIVGAVLFSLALLSIIELKLKLYTGDIKNIKKTNILALVIILIGNFIGAQTFMLWGEPVGNIIALKLSYNFFDLMLKSIGCGILMAVATTIKKPAITIMCITTFILCGFEHSIANMCYFAGNYTWDTLIFFITNIIGNSIGAISFYKLYKWGCNHDELRKN